MCGIAGIVGLGTRPVPAGAIKRMTDSLAHRGPDDAGFALFGQSGPIREFVDVAFAHKAQGLPIADGAAWEGATGARVALGHRRLAILDLSAAGHQPMAGEGRRSWVVYNGEIYNHRELRSELEDGRPFRSGSDTEVLLRLWDDRGGVANLRRLNGMFAFAMYDATNGELTLVRDRTGIKPLYYGIGEDFLLFASEPKALFASGLIEATIDAGAVAEYFTYQNLFRSGTFFRSVHLLPPGHALRVRAGDRQIEGPTTWSPPLPPADPRLSDVPDLAEQVLHSFTRAVERQLIADVDVGSYLSGGMDSGSIVAVAGRTIPRLLTFTCGFDLTNVDGLEQGFDERASAERLSYLLQTEHYDVVLHAGDMPAAMPRISWHMDDPRVGMCHQNWYVAKLASRFVKVCLAGAGGDELFGGYPWRYKPAFEAHDISSFDELYRRYWHRLLTPEELPTLFSKDLDIEEGIAETSFREVMRAAPALDDRLSMVENLLQRAFFFEWKTFLHGFLVTEDHISMAHGLETRVPFLDDDLVDLAWRIPPRSKLSPGGRDGKKILRTAMARVLPAQFTQQKKQGFSPPDENWYRGPSMDYIKAILLDPRTMGRPWFDAAFIRDRLAEHFSGKRNHRLLIWSLLSFEWLQRHYTDRPGVA